MKWKKIKCSRGAKRKVTEYTCDEISSTLLCSGVRAYKFPIQVDIYSFSLFSMNSGRHIRLSKFPSVPGDRLTAELADRGEEDHAHVPCSHVLSLGVLRSQKLLCARGCVSQK